MLPGYAKLTRNRCDNCLGCIATTFLLVLALTPLWSQDLAKGATQEAVQKVRTGNGLYDKGSYEEAEKEYLSAIAIAPNWYEPHYELGQTYFQLKRTDDARKQYELALEGDPNCWLCHQGLGNLADDSGDSDLAIEQYRKAVQLAPNQAQPRFNLAVTYVRLRRIDEAISALKEAERLKPAYASPFFLLGKLYYEQRRFYLAFDQLHEATKLETAGPRFDGAKTLIDVQLTVDEKLDNNSMASHMSYCLARAAAMTPEEYRKRFPGAETYIDDVQEEDYVLSSFATMVDEIPKKKAKRDFEQLLLIKRMGYLTPFILASSGDRFSRDREQFEQSNPGRMEEFARWAAENKISLEPIHPRCEVRWMGQVW